MRTEGDFIHINEWLIPLSWLYGIGVKFRNWLFDVGILKSKAFDVPLISVGNITVGGSGKTPHVEYLIRLLKDNMKVATLSRGYKRKTKGYILADNDSTVQEIGDEPYQMKQKFPDIYVAVDEKRTRGIESLTVDSATDDVDAILLDDAFQHRYVKPGINILLVDYHRLIIYDKLLPAGRLREPLKGKNRADIVIVTKCPKDLKPMEFRVLTKAMKLYPYQDLFFSTIDYDNPYGVFNGAELSKEDIADKNVLLLTGIASPKQIIIDLESYCKSITPINLRDHRQFSTKDIERVNETYKSLPEPRVILTTEKDATRLQGIKGLDEDIKKNIYALPIHIRFMLNEEERFNDKIISYVRKNSRNSILVKGKDDHNTPNGNHTGNRPGTISFRDN
ncbi:tetraacyldisaccharide 4'-kinase [Prevotella sp. oral taxon 376]|uniref:tetraacyldisaccharide 4'-kinase n=1 Tax=Prevotella sp. oral taxon 376 TaxID=712466 RepID=UPI000D1ECD72|nr:tetraacyldisaccharide 4'-kinase [Prevotella sp. oral taxon 376]PTL32862.1 tetraacyldisaccharide 4'-kinase [Prevotella sp. oral taxon 376]